jgi:NAD(P)-dependent dehydrogenase (short-subunit alcohol dehydrogenase family)
MAVGIVTGGGGVRIGHGICAALAAKGWTVVVADADLGAAEAVAERIGGTALPLDVTDTASVAGLVDTVRERFGRLDGLVNSAGVGLWVRAGDVTDEQFDRLHAINVRGPWRMIRAALPVMIDGGGGAIVNIGSVHAAAAEVEYSIYAGTKAGLAALTRGVARDYGRRGIRANIVHPGAVEQEGRERELDAYVASKQMLPHAVRPIDIGNAVAFLLSDEARAITGAELFVDGGSTAMLYDRTV